MWHDKGLCLLTVFILLIFKAEIWRIWGNLESIVIASAGIGLDINLKIIIITHAMGIEI